MQNKTTALHLMVDIETLGIEPSASILSIGAVFFDPDTGRLGEKFSKNITLQSNQDIGRTYTVSTLQWWMRQPLAARDKMFADDAIHISAALQGFTKFVVRVTKGKEYKVWANGPSFDITILEHAFRNIKRRPPWKYRNIRDVRTIVDLTSHLPRTPFEGVKHWALDDAIHQAKYVSERWQYIKNLVTKEVTPHNPQPAPQPEKKRKLSDPLTVTMQEALTMSDSLKVTEKPETPTPSSVDSTDSSEPSPDDTNVTARATTE